MLKSLFTLLVLYSTTAFSQDYYSYSIEGKIENPSELEASILKIEGVNACKIRIKEEKSVAEILIEILPMEKMEKFTNPSPLIDIDNLLSEKNLEIKDLIEINNK